MFEVIIPIITAIIGLVVGNILTNRRETNNRKIEKRIDYLINAFRILEKGAEPTAHDYSPCDFESAISDIQLFGNEKQVTLAHRFCEEASRGEGRSLQDLLENLRNELRDELKLPKGELPKIRPFRIQRPSDESSCRRE